MAVHSTQPGSYYVFSTSGLAPETEMAYTVYMKPTPSIRHVNSLTHHIKTYFLYFKNLLAYICGWTDTQTQMVLGKPILISQAHGHTIRLKGGTAMKIEFAFNYIN